MDGALDELQFVMEGPFTWGLPDADPVLRFRLDRAEVDLEGMLVDGVQRPLPEVQHLAVWRGAGDPGTLGVARGLFGASVSRIRPSRAAGSA